MHVLFITGQSEGGLPHYTAELANAVGRKVDATVLKPETTTADDAFGDHVEVLDVFDSIDISLPKLYDRDVNPLDVLGGFGSYRNLGRIADVDPTLVHDPTGLFPHVRAGFRLTGMDSAYPFVTTRHEVSEMKFQLRRPIMFVEELFNSAISVDVDHTIVHTERQKHAAVSGGADPETVSVVPHGAYSVFGSDEDVDRQPEPNTLLFFGNIVPQKGIETLIEAVPLLREEFPDVTLVIAGDGTIPEESQAIVQQYPENFDVHNYFVPNDEVSELFGRAQVVVCPYEFQGGTKGHSGALATAYSFGKPIVASSIGEFYSLVHREGCGKVVPPSDPEKLADAIGEILRDPEMRAEMRANSLRMARQLSWDTIAERHLDIYEQVVGRTRVPSTV